MSTPPGVTHRRQQDVVEAVQQLNTLQNQVVNDPEIATRINAYETAFRMQASVPELMDVSQEPKHIFDLYGTKGGDGSFAANCLLARRLAERGVRFVQLYHRAWDHHGGVKNATQGTAGEVDQGAAALIQDLKQRDMLKDTLVIWGGEFGRPGLTPGDGKDETGHNSNGFTFWLAGGGVKGGYVHGRTDDKGARAVEGKVHFRDLHATILHLLGLPPNDLTYWHDGREHRLTGPEGGQVVHDLLS